jgi:hypothetical protein
VKTDEWVNAGSRGIAGITACEMWWTDQMPIDNSGEGSAKVVAPAVISCSLLLAHPGKERAPG